jgi:hypothetical protein
VSGSKRRRVAQTRSDGRIDVFCPQCGAQYRIAPEVMEGKLRCTQCERTFFPKASAGKGQRKPDHTGAYWGFGIAAVLAIAGFAFLKAGGCSSGARATGALGTDGPSLASPPKK